MPSLRDSKLFNLFYKRNTEKDLVYAGKLITISNDVGSFLQYIKNVFPDYPDHGIQHSFRIIEHIEGILGDKIQHLSSAEVFCFILATLFHDTGMSLVGFAEKEALRAGHPKNAEIVIDAYFKSNMQDLKSRDRIKKTVTYVCKAHGLDIKEMYHDHDFWRVDTLEGDTVRTSVLSVLLRIGDLLDMDEQRISELSMLLLPGLYTDEAKEHNNRHLNVMTYRYDPHDLYVEVEAPTIFQYKLWKKWFGYLEEEIRYANSDLKNSDITFPILRTSIKKDNSDYEIEELRFDIDEKGGIWDIISQSIYTNEFDFVREITQNAIDASLLRIYLNDDVQLSHYSPRKWGLATEADSVLICYSEQKAQLYVIDRGTGMDASDLRQFLFKVSSTGYKDQTRRGFPFPSIAKYGIGFVSCLINADLITIYTSKYNQKGMCKVTLETGINEAFLQQLAYDDYEGTTIQLHIRRPFTFSMLNKYLRDTFRYPSAGITLIDLDSFEKVCIELGAERSIRLLEKSPYQIVHLVKDIDILKKAKTIPLEENLQILHKIETKCDELISWIRINADIDDKRTDAEKFAEFKQVSFALANMLPTDLKKHYPFARGKISQRELFNSSEEYINSAEGFLERTISYIQNEQNKLSKYSFYQQTIGSAQIMLCSNEWKYLIFYLDKDLHITHSFACNAPLDLSNETGLIFLRQSYEDCDAGVEYNAINGFLFKNGSICTRLTFLSGFHEVLSETREESFIVSSIDCHDRIQDILEEEFENSLNSDEDEIFFVSDSSGEYYTGIRFSPTYDTLFINENKFCLIRSTNEIDLQDFLQSSPSAYSDFVFNDLAFKNLFYKRKTNVEEENTNRIELDLILNTISAYYQDGIFVPVPIESLFPVGFFRILCNTTCNARMPLNVTRHEPSRISSDINTWFKLTGEKIQEILYRNVLYLLDEVNLSHPFIEMPISTSDNDLFEEIGIARFKKVITANSNY